LHGELAIESCAFPSGQDAAAARAAHPLPPTTWNNLSLSHKTRRESARER
jgi:hypothetical protein